MVEKGTDKASLRGRQRERERGRERERERERERVAFVEFVELSPYAKGPDIVSQEPRCPPDGMPRPPARTRGSLRVMHDLA